MHEPHSSRPAALGFDLTQWQAIAEATPGLVRLCDADGAALYFNRRWLVFTGVDAAEQLGSGWLQLVHAEDLPAAHGVDTDERGTVLRLRRADGTYGWIRQLTAAQVDASGARVGAVVYGIDVSSEHQQIALFRQSEERFRNLLEATSDWYWESVAMNHLRRTIRTLETMREMGVTVAMDDFGTGYSSLAYLRRFPITALKVDRQFVMNTPDDQEDATSITQAIIAMAQRLKLATIAEGVETQAQLKFLRAAGCNKLQGYLFSPPLTASAFEEFVRGYRPQAMAVT